MGFLDNLWEDVKNTAERGATAVLNNTPIGQGLAAPINWAARRSVGPAPSTGNSALINRLVSEFNMSPEQANTWLQMHADRNGNVTEDGVQAIRARTSYVPPNATPATSAPATSASRPTTAPPSLWDQLTTIGRTGSFQDPLLDAYQQYSDTIRQRVDSLPQQYQERVAELSGQFNLGATDPALAARRNYAVSDLDNQLAAALPSIAMAYDQGIADQRAAGRQARATGDELGAAYAQLFTEAANNIRAQNAEIARQYTEDYSGLGVTGAVQDGAVDIADVVAAAAPREQALSQAIGQTYAETANTLAGLLSGYSASEQAAAQRDAAVMRGGIERDYMAAESERQQREREAYRAAAQQLANQFMAMEQDLIGRQDQIGLQIAQQQAMNSPDTWARDMYRQLMGGAVAEQFVASLDGAQGQASQGVSPELQTTLNWVLGLTTAPYETFVPTEDGLASTTGMLSGTQVGAAYQAAVARAFAQGTTPAERQYLFVQTLQDRGIGPAELAWLESQGLPTNPQDPRLNFGG